jgi:hypothetical protein
MQLFDDMPHTLRGPAPYAYSHFRFLSESAQPYAENVRAILEKWFSQVAADEQLALHRRFREDFEAAFFELLVHAILVATGHTVVTHPPLQSGLATHPDYLAQHPSATDCYVEVRVSSDKSAAEAANDRMMGDLYDAIDRSPLVDYRVWLERIEFPPSKRPSARKFIEFLHNSVAKLDYDEVVEHADSLPRLEYREGEAVIEVCLIPLRRDRQPRARERTIGAFPTKTRWGSSADAIRKALKSKGGKYGRLPASFIIAVNSLSEWGTGEREAINALYGSEAVLWSGESPNVELARNADGFWLGRSGPQGTRVSAVLIGSVNPYNLHVAEPRLYLNPWAELPYDGPLLCLPQTNVTGGRIKRVGGHTLRDLLQITEPWPGEKEDN